jgi:hypothetical protein
MSNTALLNNQKLAFSAVGINEAIRYEHTMVKGNFKQVADSVLRKIKSTG